MLLYGYLFALTSIVGCNILYVIIDVCFIEAKWNRIITPIVIVSEYSTRYFPSFVIGIV